MKATLSDVAVGCTTNQICAGRGELASRDTNEELEEPQEIQCYKAEATIEPQINTNIQSFLLMFSFVFINCFVPKDHRQITFVMLNRFSLLRRTSRPCSRWTISSMMEYQAKLNERYMPVLHCISSLKGTSYKKFLSCFT